MTKIIFMCECRNMTIRKFCIISSAFGVLQAKPIIVSTIRGITCERQDLHSDELRIVLILIAPLSIECLVVSHIGRQIHTIRLSVQI